jgi:hypothetical protein
VELKPEDRRGREPAGGGDCDHGAEAVAQRIALQHALETWDEDEDRDHRSERQLKAGVEQRVRVPSQEDDRSDEEEVPPVCDPRCEPRDDAERSRDAGPDDRRLRADRDDVDHDRREGAELADDA